MNYSSNFTGRLLHIQTPKYLPITLSRYSTNTPLLSLLTAADLVIVTLVRLQLLPQIFELRRAPGVQPRVEVLVP